MGNSYLDTSLVDKAIKFAVDAHSNTERRGKKYPYIIHSLEAMEIVASITNDPELLAAAVLHDTIEDTNTSENQIRALFGSRIAKIVSCESDDPQINDWRERKQAALNKLKEADRDSLIVALSDKLSNMRAIWRDYQSVGDDLWKIFHASSKDDIAWRYNELVRCFNPLEETFAFKEFKNLVNSVFNSNQ